MTKRRGRIRDDAFPAAFGRRLRRLLAETGARQGALARELGGYRPETLSRLAGAKSASIALDLLIRLAEWAEGRGISARWLILGAGPMHREEAVSAAGRVDLAGATTTALSHALLLVLGRRMGLDLEAIARRWWVDMPLPGGEAAAVPIAGLVEAIESQCDGAEAPAPPAAPAGRPVAGYRTVPPEDVPSDPSWSEHYVPLVCCAAAGAGIETIEASEHPPGWAGEFVVYDGAPETAVAVRVRGESMAPRYRDGDVVIVDPARPAASGEVCCCLVDRDGAREARIKRLRLGGRWATLESLAPGRRAERIPRGRLLAAYAIVDHLPKMVRHENYPG